MGREGSVASRWHGVREVLDPNVLVSALISDAGLARQIIDAWARERFELVVSPALLGELGEVSVRPRLGRVAHGQ
jgi:predicted nucleic acid-binding protein